MFYILKTEHRIDGVINLTQTARQSFATGLAEFFAQCSAAPTNVNFTSVDVAIVDDKLEPVRPVEHIDGAVPAQEG